jgi:peptidoglycan/xylan/chitin deacetylase (PgdA/CDA1 family)
MIEVAVIARPGSVTLAHCRAALRVAGCVAPQVFEIGDDGPAQARNAALAQCRQPILALVEDDVVVAPGWLDAVAGAWRDPRTAIAGGPLAGAAGLRVAQASPTYPGGNVALRASAVRGAGGFWPARGDAAARDWFSEEHEAQRELRRMGWSSVFVAGMAARRLGGEPSLSQRLKAGARRQAVGTPRPGPEAARALVRGLAGAAMGRRRERLGRAAENLGVLLGPRIVERELDPVVTETPFRPSVPAPARARRARRRGSAPAVLVYHRIAELHDDPLGLAVSPANWAEQLEVLRARGVAPLEAVVTGNAADGALAVTFDDGYADNLVLREAGIPVTVFIATGHVEDAKRFWWDGVAAACHARCGEILAVEDRAFVLGDVARGHLLAWLQPRAPQDIDRVVEALRPPPTDRPLTVEELRDLARHVAIGAHSRTHRSLRHATPDEQRADVERCRDDLAAWLGKPPSAFAYPFGVQGEAFDDTSKRIVREAGFALAVQNGMGRAGDRFAVPRRAVPDIGGEAFARWLDGS